MSSVATKLNSSRQALLDLSTRNRLLSTPRHSKTARIVEIVDERCAEIFRLLVQEQKTLSFLPKKDAAAQIPREEQPPPNGVAPVEPAGDAAELTKRHTDLRLQTLLPAEALQKRLLSMYYDAATFEEEQGVNILFLAVGMLRWFEADNQEVPREAPLILVPVSLERGTAAERFKLRWRNEDCAANLSLQAKMKADFGLSIPDLPESDDLDVGAYMESVRAAVSGQERFVVEEDAMVLGFFSFAKFLMYRDLDGANWPESTKLEQHSLIVGLMGEGFRQAEGMIGEDANIDQHLLPSQMFHVVDADSSQTLAIEEVRRGRNLVIQGPPGTGKSQTITNIIANAVYAGKKVLFVAEKMAALEVVYRRMSNIGLAPLCMELHSHKANKRAVLEELKRTRELGRPQGGDGAQLAERVQALRDQLNVYAAVLHTVEQPSGLTPFEIIGHVVRLRLAGMEARGITLEEPERWTADDKRQREELIGDLVLRIAQIGLPAEHPWRGVCRGSLLPNEYAQLCDDLTALKRIFDKVTADVALLRERFPQLGAALAELRRAKAAVQAAAALPEADYTVLAHPLWRESAALLEELVQAGLQREETKQRLSDTVTDAAWSTDLQECRRQIALHGESIFRIFRSGYRQAISLLKSLLSVSLPKDHAARLAIVDGVLAVQRSEKLLAEQREAGASAFGRYWQETRSSWKVLQALVSWRTSLDLKALPDGFLESCAGISAREEVQELSGQAAPAIDELFKRIESLFRELQLDLPAAFGVRALEDVDSTALLQRLDQWISQSESISKWTAFKARYDALCAGGAAPIAKKLWHGELTQADAHGVFERAYFDAMADLIFRKHPQLREFDGHHHELTVKSFCENDRQWIEQARIALRAQHYNGMPKGDGGIGPLGVLNGEFAKKRNHLPIRQLVRRAGPAIQALKPVFMMSPLSVAQFLEPGAVDFDLMVMDEASQVEPVDALGAIARAKQVVVVGDTKQLPPTRFFLRMTGNVDEEEEADEESGPAVRDVESILNLCLARGLPQRMLRWHYRSRHQSLIAVSNREFYENRLYIIPSPFDAASGMGLKFNYLPQGVFDSGGSATNVIEAKAVAAAVIQHAQVHPELSLGVGAFSIKQRQAILDELEAMRQAHPETEQFFMQRHPDEPFFVKNLENIQGDERDVIFISVGYGKNQSGTMAMRFGPLSAEGGERRLNVLISRAKRRCEVFSSITADDIDLERARGAGVAAFKLFLRFAQTGMLDAGPAAERAAGQVFEEQVAAALRARGYEVKTQIGIAGLFVDVGVLDPKQPGRYVLGIECDGRGYSSARSARDRDRIRSSVLGDHGWNLHRIWSTDWYRRPNEQLELAVKAIESARAQLAAGDEPAPKAPAVFQIAEVAEEVSKEHESGLSVPYEEAAISVPKRVQPHELPDHKMAELVARIVEVEGPIHESEVVTRVRMLWDLSRAGNRIQAKVKAGIDQAKQAGRIMQDGEFYLAQGAEIKVRDRSAVSSPTLRKPECLPPLEIRKAIVTLLEANFGASHQQIPTEVARLFGFKATSAQLREVIEPEIEALKAAGKLQQSGDQLVVVS